MTKAQRFGLAGMLGALFMLVIGIALAFMPDSVAAVKILAISLTCALPLAAGFVEFMKEAQ